MDDQTINALYLRSYYDKYYVDKEDMENIITLNPQDIVAKIKSYPKILQESILSLIIQNVAYNNPIYMDMNKWDVINNAFQIDIKSFAERVYIKK